MIFIMREQLFKKIKEIKPNEPFLATITFFDRKKTDRLNTFVFSNKFPYEEFEGTKEVINKLIDEQKARQFKK